MMHGQRNIKSGILCRYSDSLWPGRSGDRIPVGARFSVPVQTGPGAHPASYTKSTGSFPGVKPQGRGVDHPPQSSAEVKERVQLYLYSAFGPSLPVLGWTFTFYTKVLCTFLCFLLNLHSKKSEEDPLRSTCNSQRVQPTGTTANTFKPDDSC